MYKWVVISFFILSSFLAVVFQSDFWPFSSYAMFSSSLTNTSLKQHRDYSLVGENPAGQQTQIQNQTVTGAISPGMVGVAISTLVNEERNECVTELLQYWGRRYAAAMPHLPERLKNFEKLMVIEKNHNSMNAPPLFQQAVQKHD